MKEIISKDVSETTIREVKESFIDGVEIYYLDNEYLQITREGQAVTRTLINRIEARTDYRFFAVNIIDGKLVGYFKSID